jgi:hypothetical protein
VAADVEESIRKRDRRGASRVRKDLMRLAREAEATEKHAEGLRTSLTELPHPYSELLNANLESTAKTAVSLIAEQVPWFHELSSVADTASALARAIQDKGGAPKMLAFRILVLGLKPAFEHATGHSAGVTWNPVESRYEGDFINLVEAVVPLALSLETANRSMRIPRTESARGRYIDRMTGGQRT